MHRPTYPVRTLVIAVAMALGLSLGAGQTAYAADNPVTPGDFTGYGFDQCLTPEQYKMNAWLESSPFLAVGIYISGKSRACRDQPNLTPEWVSTQLAKGWRLLPITLGPQADCLDRFPRYGDDPTIIPTPGKNGRYSQARKQGSTEATTAVAEATRLGIVPGSTLWYDLEGFNANDTTCRESALWFLSGWTKQIRRLGYVSGVYSSVGSGIKMLDDARVQRPGVFTLPDRIWLARWDGLANTSSDYILEDGWRPGGRMKQYKGGHDERWGGVKINIDSNFIELGNGLVAPAEVHCDGTRVDFKDYPRLAPPKSGKRPGKRMVIAAEVPAPASRASTPGSSRASTRRGWSRPSTRGRRSGAWARPTPGASATGWPCSAAARTAPRARSSRSARRVGTYDASSARSTPPTRPPGSR